MRKTALALFTFIVLPMAQWASAQPVVVPCPEMKMAAGNPPADPCPLRDCCRLTAPDSPPAALITVPAQVKPAGLFLLPILLQTRISPAPALRDRAPALATAALLPHKPPPSALLIPLRV